MTQTTPFNQEIALTIIREGQTNPFPIKLEDVNNWLDSTRKDDPIKYLSEKGFERDYDFVAIPKFRETPVGGRPGGFDIYLSVDCCKQYCMMSNKPNGKVVRRYFVDAEKQLKAIHEQPATIEQSKDGMILQSLAGILENINTQKAILASELEANRALAEANKERLDKASTYTGQLKKQVDNVESITNSNKELLDKLFIPEGYATISGFFNDRDAHNYHVPTDSRAISQMIGKAASVLSKKGNHDIHKVHSAQFANGINAYKIDVITLAIAILIKDGKLVSTRKRVRDHLTIPQDE